MGTNRVFPKDLVNFPGKARAFNVRNWSLTLRVEYTKKRAPFIYQIEQEFQKLALGLARTIEPSDHAVRKVLFNSRYSTDATTCAQYFVTGRAYDLTSNQWASPCIKCHHVFRGLWTWEGGGEPVRWMRFPLMNCGEP
jgi:hypothetical protein